MFLFCVTSEVPFFVGNANFSVAENKKNSWSGFVTLFNCIYDRVTTVAVLTLRSEAEITVSRSSKVREISDLRARLRSVTVIHAQPAVWYRVDSDNVIEVKPTRLYRSFEVIGTIRASGELHIGDEFNSRLFLGAPDVFRGLTSGFSAVTAYGMFVTLVGAYLQNPTYLSTGLLSL